MRSLGKFYELASYRVREVLFISSEYDAFILETEGMPAGYRLRYQTHVQSVGWTGWVKSGFATGSVGMKKQIEAVRIQVIQNDTN